MSVTLIASRLRAPDQSPAGTYDSSNAALVRASIGRLIAQNVGLTAEIPAFTTQSDRLRRENAALVARVAVGLS